MAALFDSIKYVTSGITLIAFIAATIAWAYRAHLKTQKQTIELAKADDRAVLVERTLRVFYGRHKRTYQQAEIRLGAAAG